MGARRSFSARSATSHRVVIRRSRRTMACHFRDGSEPPQGSNDRAEALFSLHNARYHSQPNRPRYAFRRAAPKRNSARTRTGKLADFSGWQPALDRFESGSHAAADSVVASRARPTTTGWRSSGLALPQWLASGEITEQGLRVALRRSVATLNRKARPGDEARVGVHPLRDAPQAGNFERSRRGPRGPSTVAPLPALDTRTSGSHPAAACVGGAPSRVLPGTRRRKLRWKNCQGSGCLT